MSNTATVRTSDDLYAALGTLNATPDAGPARIVLEADTLRLPFPALVLRHGLAVEGHGCTLADGYGFRVEASQTLFRGLTFTHWLDDALQFIGPQAQGAAIVDCRFADAPAARKTASFLGVRLRRARPGADEAISIVRGAGGAFRISRSTFEDVAKVVLVGSGDNEWEQAERNAEVSLRVEDTVFLRCCRRMPFVRYGEVLLQHCRWEDWGAGKNWSVKTHAVRAEGGAHVTIQDSHWEQRSRLPMGLWCGIADWFANRFRPGGTLGVLRDRASTVEVDGCTRSANWIRWG